MPACPPHSSPSPSPLSTRTTRQVAEDVLRICLSTCTAAASMLEHEACHLLAPRLVHAVLGADRSLPRDVKRTGLLLICAALFYSSAAYERRPEQRLQLSVNEINERREQRLAVCQASGETSCKTWRRCWLHACSVPVGSPFMLPSSFLVPSHSRRWSNRYCRCWRA